MSWPGVRFPLALAEADAGNAVPAVANVAGRAPAVRQSRRHLGALEVQIVREAQDNVAPTRQQRIVHLLHLRLFDRLPVVFEIIESPVRPLLRILPRERV